MLQQKQMDDICSYFNESCLAYQSDFTTMSWFKNLSDLCWPRNLAQRPFFDQKSAKHSIFLVWAYASGDEYLNYSILSSTKGPQGYLALSIRVQCTVVRLPLDLQAILNSSLAWSWQQCSIDDALEQCRLFADFDSYFGAKSQNCFQTDVHPHFADEFGSFLSVKLPHFFQYFR